MNIGYSASHTYFQGWVVHGRHLIFLLLPYSTLYIYFVDAYVAPTERTLKNQYLLHSLVFTSTPEFSHMGFYNKSIIIGTGGTAYYYRFQMYLIIMSCFQ